MSKKISLLLRAAVSTALMALLMYIMRDSIPKMLGALKRLPVSIFFLGLLLFLASSVIVSFRLKILLAAQKIFVRMSHLIRLTFVGYFFSSFLPTSVGGDVVKAFYISKASGKTMQSYASVFVDRLLGMFTLFLIATAALFYAANVSQYHLRRIALLALAGLILFLVVLFNRRASKILSFLFTPAIPPKLRDKFKNAYNAIHEYKKYKLEIVKCFFVSIAAQVTAFSVVYVLGLGLKSHIPLKSLLFAMPVASIASMLPSLYGMGPREMAITMLLGPITGKEKALAIAFLWLGILLIAALIGGVTYALMGMYKVKPEELSA